MAVLPQLLCGTEHEGCAACADEGSGDSYCGVAEADQQQPKEHEAFGTLAAVFVAEARRDYEDAKERGASQEEVDRLKAKYDALEKEKDSIFSEYRAAKAELGAAREEANAANAEMESAREAALTPAEKVSKLEQKVDDLTKQFWDNFDARDQANRDYLDAKERGASQEEIDRLKAKYDELAKEQRQILDDRRTVRVELESAREAANAAEPKQQTVEQPVQQQSGGETTVTTQEPQQTQPAQQGPQQLTREEATQAWNDAQQKTEDARANAEKAANDYLLALKSGDKYTIDAFKEELQKANDALLAAKREETAASQALTEAADNISRASNRVREAGQKH